MRTMAHSHTSSGLGAAHKRLRQSGQSEFFVSLCPSDGTVTLSSDDGAPPIEFRSPAAVESLQSMARMRVPALEIFNALPDAA